VEGNVSDFYIKTHAYAVDDYGDWYLKDSPFGGRIGHPTLLANDILRLFFLLYDVRPPFPSGLHAKNELELLRPVKLGDKVVVRGKHTEKYEKRGQNVRVVEGQAADEAGRPFIRMRAWETVGLASTTPVGQGSGKPSADLITGEAPAGAPIATKAGKQVPVGAVLPSIAKHTTLEQSIAFSGSVYGWVEGGAKTIRYSIHTDPEDARRRGVRDAIVQGLCSAAYLSEVCTNFFGPLWLTTGRLATNFIRPVIVRDDITACGMVKKLEPEGGKTRIHLDLWCKNQNGELATVGRASALAE
jgi:acyl dehydratase